MRYMRKASPIGVHGGCAASNPAEGIDRTGKRNELTPLGQAVAVRARRMVFEAAELRRSAELLKQGDLGAIRIGLGSGPGAMLMTPFLVHMARHHPGVAQFADLSFDDQTAYLKHVEHTSFFGGMRFLTVLGLLALPSYGGNADKLGWKLVGFVDQHAWQPPFGHYDAGYAGFVPYAKATEQRS